MEGRRSRAMEVLSRQVDSGRIRGSVIFDEALVVDTETTGPLEQLHANYSRRRNFLEHRWSTTSILLDLLYRLVAIMILLAVVVVVALKTLAPIPYL